ncbi:MAG: hypothetical protein U0M25_05430, partial [Oscillospiraceae bacterium]|nr:hypothetical protein [Oscillospiraceae bacterium]
LLRDCHVASLLAMTRQGGAAVETVHCIEFAVVLPLRGREGHAPPLQRTTGGFVKFSTFHLPRAPPCKSLCLFAKLRKFYHSTPQDGMQA